MKTILKSSVAAAALMAVAAPTMAQSNIETGNAKVKLKIYGQVNKAVMWGDDGNNSRTFIVDNNASSTRFGFIATAPVNADFAFGAQIEAEMKSNSAGATSSPQGPTTPGVQINTGAAGGGSASDSNVGDTTFIERIAEVTMDHKRFGKVSLGNGPEASDGTVEYNLAGGVTNVIGALGAGALGSTVMYDKTNARYYNVALKNTTTAAGITNGTGIALDVGNRDDRVRYDTPRMMGLRASASFSSGGAGSAGLDYDNKFGAFKIVGGAGYQNIAGRHASGQEQFGGSIAVLHDSGLNASIATSHRIYKQNVNTNGQGIAGGEHHDTGNSNTIGGTVGYLAKVFGVGPTGFAFDYYTTANNRVQGSSTDTWALGINQEFSDIGTDVYLMYRNYSHDIGTREKNRTAANQVGDIDDVNVVMTGVRVKF